MAVNDDNQESLISDCFNNENTDENSPLFRDEDKLPSEYVQKSSW